MTERYVFSNTNIANDEMATDISHSNIPDDTVKDGDIKYKKPREAPLARTEIIISIKRTSFLLKYCDVASLSIYLYMAIIR